MNNITNTPQVFDFDHHQIRTTTQDGQIWFVANDIAEALSYANSKDALKRHVDSEDRKGVAFHDPLGKNPQTMNTINESGMYSLILSSKKAEAKKFKRWVTSQVLPQLRKTGTYTLPKPPTIRRINAEGRARVRDMVRQLVDHYPDHYFDQNPQDRVENCVYQRRSAYLLTYGFIKTYFDLDKGGYKNLTADELNSLETVLDDKQDEFLGSDVFMLTRISPNNVMTKAPQIKMFELSHKALSQATDFVKDNKPSELDFYHYTEKDKAIHASIYSIKMLVDQSAGVSFDDQSGFALKLETLEHAYQTTNTLAHQIYDKSKQLKTLMTDLTNLTSQEQEVDNEQY